MFLATAKLGRDSLEILLWSLKTWPFPNDISNVFSETALIPMASHKIQYFPDSIATINYSLTTE